MPYTVETSDEIVARNMKYLFWGDFGTRKTESALRFFPHVLMIDSEGNSDQCVGVKDIKQFKRVQTKNPKEALEVISDAAKGKIKFADGSPVETLCFDSTSVLWSVQQEVASSLAEKRAVRYHKEAEEATTTQLDWVVSKRPMKKLYTAANNSPFKHLIFIARRKDFYKEDPTDSKKLIKDGYAPDTMKGIEYEVNFALYMAFDDNQKWYAEVTKVQGALGLQFPKGKKLTKFPAAELLAYAEHYVGKAVEAKSEDEIADDQAEEQTAPKPLRTQTALIQYARDTYKLEPKDLGPILKAAGINDFKPELWDRCIAAFAGHIAQRA